MSRGAHALRLSGILGIAVGALFGNVQYAYRSPMMLGGSQASPGWMVATHVHILGLSIIAIVLSLILDHVFLSNRTAVAVLVVIGQWVEPASIYLVEGLNFGPGGLVGQLAALLNLLMFLAFAVNYVRNAWGHEPGTRPGGT